MTDDLAELRFLNELFLRYVPGYEIGDGDEEASAEDVATRLATFSTRLNLPAASATDGPLAERVLSDPQFVEKLCAQACDVVGFSRHCVGFERGGGKARESSSASFSELMIRPIAHVSGFKKHVLTVLTDGSVWVDFKRTGGGVADFALMRKDNFSADSIVRVRKGDVYLEDSSHSIKLPIPSESFRRPKSVNASDCSPDLRHLAFASDSGELLVWDLAVFDYQLVSPPLVRWTRAALRSNKSPLRSVRYSPKGNKLAYAKDSWVGVFDSYSLEQTHTYTMFENPNFRIVEWITNSTLVGSTNESLHVFDLTTNKTCSIDLARARRKCLGHLTDAPVEQMVSFKEKLFVMFSRLNAIALFQVYPDSICFVDAVRNGESRVTGVAVADSHLWLSSGREMRKVSLEPRATELTY